MSGNIWQSSHCAQWVLDKIDLSWERAANLAVLSEEEYTKYNNGFNFLYRANSILECEFYLLENMDCYLVVFQPYR